ncbi:MAG: hypothetical protein KY410_00950 [Proteobacteria bacterium]|nr:hypothetical protein [Pseudomonadota bacterium]
MFAGLLTFLFLAALGVAAEFLLIDRLHESRLNEWLAEHIYLPALRMPALIGFILASYPTLYGLEAGPPLAALLDFNWFGRALNILFMLPLLFSLLPVAGRFSALVLPAQGMALTALLFMPLAAALDLETASYRPDLSTLVALLLFGIGGHVLGTALAERLPRRRAALPAYDATVLAFQAPVILAYGHALGLQAQ